MSCSLLVSYRTLAPRFPGHWFLRSQRGEKCEEIENGELTVPRRRSDRRKTIREVDKILPKHINRVSLQRRHARAREITRRVVVSRTQKKFPPPRPVARVRHGRSRLVDTQETVKAQPVQSTEALVAAVAAPAPDKKGKFTSGLCGCCQHICTCCMAMWCCTDAVILGQMYEKQDPEKRKGSCPTPCGNQSVRVARNLDSQACRSPATSTYYTSS